MKSGVLDIRRGAALTKLEKQLKRSIVHNAAQNVAYRVNRLNDAYENDLSRSILERRRREMRKAVDVLVEVSTSRVPDSFLEYWAGPEAVRDRDRLLGQSGNVTALKRNGRPISPNGGD